MLWLSCLRHQRSAVRIQSMENFYIEHLSSYCQKTKLKKKRPGMLAHFWKKFWCIDTLCWMNLTYKCPRTEYDLLMQLVENIYLCCHNFEWHVGKARIITVCLDVWIILKYLAVYNNENLPDCCFWQCSKLYQIQGTRLNLKNCQRLKLCQIWSHC